MRRPRTYFENYVTPQEAAEFLKRQAAYILRREKNDPGVRVRADLKLRFWNEKWKTQEARSDE